MLATAVVSGLALRRAVGCARAYVQARSPVAPARERKPVLVCG